MLPRDGPKPSKQKLPSSLCGGDLARVVRAKSTLLSLADISTGRFCLQSKLGYAGIQFSSPALETKETHVYLPTFCPVFLLSLGAAAGSPNPSSTPARASSLQAPPRTTPGPDARQRHPDTDLWAAQRL
jgi:hypothetical protein